MPLKKGSDQLMPVGLYMAFLAASKGAKRVGIVSDLDGHDQIVHDLIRPFAEMHFVQPHQMCGARITTYGYTTLTMRVRPDNLVDEVKPESYSQASFRAFLGETLVVKCWDIALKSLLKD